MPLVVPPLLRPKPEAVAAMRVRAGLSIPESAAAGRVSERQWERYERGDCRIPVAVWELYLIRLRSAGLLNDHKPPAVASKPAAPAVASTVNKEAR